MINARLTSRFKKDYDKLEKRGFDMRLLDEAMDCIVQEKELDVSFRKHALEPKNRDPKIWELHVGGRKSDWLLLYSYLEREHENPWVIFNRTGTHSDLFD